MHGTLGVPDNQARLLKASGFGNVRVDNDEFPFQKTFSSNLKLEKDAN